MATLYITEYVVVATTMHGGSAVPVPQEPPVAEQAIPITAGSTQTAAFNVNTRLVRIETDAICGVTFGANPTAIVVAGGLGSQRLIAGQAQFHGVTGGMKAAVIATT